MFDALQQFDVGDNDLVNADHMASAVTAATIIFDDGATQVFTADGHTTYTDHGRPTHGDWWVSDEGQFVSFWPPSYQASYTVRWVVEGGMISGLTFTDTERGTRFAGRYL